MGNETFYGDGLSGAQMMTEVQKDINEMKYFVSTCMILTVEERIVD